MNSLQAKDYFVFLVYFIIVAGYGYWIYQRKRSKEISIRKVLGASLIDILTLLNRVFIKLVIVANLIAWPIAYIVLKDWLNDFAFRTELSVWPFVVSGTITLLLTIVIVSLQAFNTANANPSNNLKYE